MRTVTAGNGTDSTSAVVAYLAAGNKLHLANLYLIGNPEDPQAQWLTDWETPLSWPAWGTFYPSGKIVRDQVTSSFGLDVKALNVSWSPKPTAATQSIVTANPYQLAQLGFYDSQTVRVWTVYMPTPGDANTFGASELFGGRIADVTVERGEIKFTINSFLDVVNQQVPLNVIELYNTMAAYRGATPPAGFSQVPQFSVVSGGGSTTTTVIGNCTSPSAGHVFSTNAFQLGFLVFNPGGTLDGVWTAIQTNYNALVGATHYNGFVLYAPLPWAPTAGVDTFYVSAASPINQADGTYYGFPYVPDPTAA